ncbi:probable N-acetyltransferase camello [Schistocerca serialis cubense]|uniref:probable N-acetyltransferase camello n=1 Tax=Schistocerca serialis cubense TaxID=2023355 RepID=UPI00214EF433|nr:probable N-acetyltransferase camello [Schistocerca serialis cubense]XP_049947348.1 probable N-acetyltransferase camello [Schistocerca serialis cubense]
MGTVVIRYYQPGDQLQCQEIVKEGIMSTVNTAFFAGLLREITFQSIILVSALLFIFVGVPFRICFLTVPASVIFIVYGGIYFAHVMRAMEVSQEIADIPRVYMSSRDTGFWVAEVHEPLSNTLKPKSEIKYRLATEHDQLNALGGYQRRVVGTIAVMRCRTTDNAAWIRRLAVSSDYRRKGIGSALVDRALSFCSERGYKTAELVTTECHSEAGALYFKKGFETKQIYHRQIIGSLVTVMMYSMTKKTDCLSA